MPKKNQRSITIRKDVYELAEKQAEAEEKSVSKHVTDLIMEKEVPASG